MFIHFYAYALHAHWPSGFSGCTKSVLFGQDAITASAEHAVRYFECRSAANTHTTLPVFVWRVVYDLQCVISVTFWCLISESSTSVCSVINRNICGEPVDCP